MGTVLGLEGQELCLVLENHVLVGFGSGQGLAGSIIFLEFNTLLHYCTLRI
nr:hypothetical protein [uncultured Acetatifactor sp.]